MATRKAVGLLDRSAGLPDTFWYSTKRRLLGPPLVNQDLGEQRLSNPLALGVLSPDGISSSAYGTEEILIALVPAVGLAAFSLLLPMTLVILLVMVLVLLSYREIVMVYIRPGGSYVVARENFGPRIAQVCAVALLIDYVVTVAVQTSAGTAAVASAIPAVGPYKLEITVGVVVLMAFGNLRGLKEAGRAFAIPTYLFSGAVILMIVVGLIRDLTGNLGRLDPAALHGAYTIGSSTEGLISGAMIFTLLRAFANGGASLTGIEAVSNAVGAFRPPEGRNARKVLMTEGAILGVLIAGISWLAYRTHATPRLAGYPTVLAQEAQLIFGNGFIGKAFFYLLQLATMLILYTGANTSFNGFPFLTSYVAGDSFLPRWLLKRGHRLVFSNAIILLTIVSVSLIIIKDADVNSLVPLYAIGVFTAFAMAGFGMAKYHSQAQGARLAAQAGHQLRGRRDDLTRGGRVRDREVHRGRLGGRGPVRHPGPGADQDEPGVRRGRRGARDDQREPAAASAALRPAHRLRLRGRLRPGHPGRAAVRAEPAAHQHPRGALRHQQRPGRQAAGEVDPRQPGRHPGLHRRLRPQADPGRGRTRRAGDRRPGHARDRDPAPAQLLRAARAAAARPHRGQDRRGGEPDPAFGRDHHPLRRGEPRPGAAGAPGGHDGGRGRGPRGPADQDRSGRGGGPARHAERGSRNGAAPSRRPRPAACSSGASRNRAGPTASRSRSRRRPPASRRSAR